MQEERQEILITGKHEALACSSFEGFSIILSDLVKAGYRIDAALYHTFGHGTIVATRKAQAIKETNCEDKEWDDDSVRRIINDYDRQFKIDTFAYQYPCKYSVDEWFEKNKDKFKSKK